MDQLVAAAKKEGKVVVATSPDESFRKGVLGAFQAKYGIQGENLSDPVATLQNRLVQEKSAGVHSTDVYLTAGAYIPPAYDAGLYAPIKPLIILPDAADPSKWIKGSGAPGPWYMDPKQQDLIRVAASLRYTFNINPDKIDASQIKKPEDMLDPKYKGKITAYDPTIGGIGKPVAALILKTMGDDYFKKLYVGQAPKLAQDDRTIGDWVAKGTYPIGIGLANDEAQRQKAAGFKTAVLKLDSPVSAALASGQYVMGVLVSPPHPNAAKLFVNWMLTQEAMQAIANSDGVATTRTDVDYSKVDPNIIPAPNGTYFDENNWAYVTGEQTALFARIKPLLS
jgi:iron(III) transport system substrate-binding protein